MELIAMQMVVPHVEVSDRNSLKLHKTTKDEKSTMTYNDLMAFVGMDYAVAAQSLPYTSWDFKQNVKNRKCFW